MHECFELNALSSTIDALSVKVEAATSRRQHAQSGYCSHVRSWDASQRKTAKPTTSWKAVSNGPAVVA
ncbi:MAG: hypothetical protein C4345_09650, partial [Chloroflexota bacterium]